MLDLACLTFNRRFSHRAEYAATLAGSLHRAALEVRQRIARLSRLVTAAECAQDSKSGSSLNPQRFAQQLSDLLQETRSDLDLTGHGLGLRSCLVLVGFLANKTLQVRSSIKVRSRAAPALFVLC